MARVSHSRVGWGLIGAGMLCVAAGAMLWWRSAAASQPVPVADMMHREAAATRPERTSPGDSAGTAPRPDAAWTPDTAALLAALQPRSAATAAASPCDTLRPHPATRLDPSAPRAFWFCYGAAGARREPRWWTQVDSAAWRQRHPDGREDAYRGVGRATVHNEIGGRPADVTGWIVTSGSGSLQLFIPDRGAGRASAAGRWARFRYLDPSAGPANRDTTWKPLAELRERPQHR